MTEELKCPKCDSTNIDGGEVVDSDSGFGEYVELCVGTCQDCGAKIRYSVVYRFVGFDDIEEEDE